MQCCAREQRFRVLTISLVDDGPPTRPPPPLPPIISKATPPPLPPPDPLSRCPVASFTKCPPPPLPPRETATEEKLFSSHVARAPHRRCHRAARPCRALSAQRLRPLPPRRNSAPLIHQTMGSTVDERHLIHGVRHSAVHRCLSVLARPTHSADHNLKPTPLSHVRAPTASPPDSSATGAATPAIPVEKKAWCGCKYIGTLCPRAQQAAGV